MTGLLPDNQIRCTAYWYAASARLLTGNGDLDFLSCLGLHAARLARWHGIPAWQVPEGPFLVWMWPEWIWDATVTAMADAAAGHGDYADLSGHGYWEAGDYG